MESKSGLFEILEKIKAKPGMYLGQPSVLDLFVFLAGYKTARRELGIEPTDREITFYEGFNEFVQSFYQIHSSKSWAKIIESNCIDDRHGFDKFFELLAEFETSSKNLNQIQNDFIKL
jgi:hypothetical protein